MLIPVLIGMVSAVGSTSPLGADKLVAKLEAMQVLVARDFDTTFELQVFPRRPIDDERAWEADDWESLEDFQFVAVGRRFFNRRTVYKRGGGASAAAPTTALVQENVWAEGAWTHRLSVDASVSLFAQPRPTDQFLKAFLFNLVEGRFPTPLATLAELVRGGHTLLQEVEDGVLTYRFAESEELATSVQHIIRARLEPTFELLSHAIEFARPEADGSFEQRRHVRTTYEVLEWEQLGDVRLPKRARVDAVSPQNLETLEGPPWLWRAVYTRKSFEWAEAGSVDTELFTVPMPVGTKVYDDRLKLSFEIGKTYLSLDGTMYEVAEPIMEHPGDRLGEVLRNAQPLIPPADGPRPLPGSASTTPSVPARPSGSRLTVSALIAIGAGLLTLAIYRGTRFR